jgi:hypothetical protein
MGNVCCPLHVVGGERGEASTAVVQRTADGVPPHGRIGDGLTKKQLLAAQAGRLSTQSHERAQLLFRQYRTRASSLPMGPDALESSIPPSPEPRTPNGIRSSISSNSDSLRMPQMTQRDLRQLMHDVDPELFQFVWGLFDVSGEGVVYADDFVAAMALLTTSAEPNATFEDQIKACFVMFDTRNDGRLGCVPAAAAAAAIPPHRRRPAAATAATAPPLPPPPPRGQRRSPPPPPQPPPPPPPPPRPPAAVPPSCARRATHRRTDAHAHCPRRRALSHAGTRSFVACSRRR